MKNLSRILLVSVGILFFGLSLNAFARQGNPLRSTLTPAASVAPQSFPASQQSSSLSESARSQLSREVYQAAFPENLEPAPTQPPPVSSASSTILDSNVRPAGHMAEPKRDAATSGELPNLSTPSLPPSVSAEPKSSLQDIIARLSSTTASNADSSQNQFVESAQKPSPVQEPDGAPGTTKFDQERFQQILKQLATNTGLVLVIGVGFILFAKRWVKGSKPARKKDGVSIEIKSTLKLSPKSNLYLIKAGDQRLIVANDQNGIKSVVPLTESFADSLDAFSDMTAEPKSNAVPDAKPVPEQATDPKTEGVTLSLSESLLALAKQSADSSKFARPTANQATTNHHSVESIKEQAVRRKMEAALREHGIKELILQNMRSQG